MSLIEWTMFFKTGGNIFRNAPPTVWAWTVLNADPRSKQVIAKVTATLRFSILITLGYLAWLGLWSFYIGHLIIRFYTNQENLNSNTGSWRYKKTAWLNSKIKYPKDIPYRIQTDEFNRILNWNRYEIFLECSFWALCNLLPLEFPFSNQNCLKYLKG